LLQRGCNQFRVPLLHQFNWTRPGQLVTKLNLMTNFLLPTLGPAALPLLHASDQVAVVATSLRMAQRLSASCRVLVARLQDVHLASDQVSVKQL